MGMPVLAENFGPANALSVGGFAQAEPLRADGFVLLRSAIPGHCLQALRDAFDAGVKPSEQWPVPRGADWRHAQLDLEPQVQAICRLPPLLAAVATLIGERFFLGQVEGREPVAGGGHQALHRDFSAQRPGDTAVAIAYLDDYGPENGATRILAGSHRPSAPGAAIDVHADAYSVQLSGSAGDILVFDADLVHAGCVNRTGARRRSLLMGFFAAPLYASNLETADLRGVRMPAAWFDVAPAQNSKRVNLPDLSRTALAG
jgi:hypothetical protein